MAAPPFLFRLQWGGPLCGTEMWSCGVHVAGTSDINILPGAFETAIKSWFQNSQTAVGTAAGLAWIKFNRLDPETGRYLSQTDTKVFDLVTPVYGATGQTAPQLTLAATLKTTAVRGPAHAGRIYPPVTVASYGADGKVSTTIATNLATSTATLLTALNSVMTPNGDVCVWSQTRQSYNLVTGVTVGDVMDTQRRRRGNLIEVRSSVKPVT